MGDLVLQVATQLNSLYHILKNANFCSEIQFKLCPSNPNFFLLPSTGGDIVTSDPVAIVEEVTATTTSTAEPFLFSHQEGDGEGEEEGGG